MSNVYGFSDLPVARRLKRLARTGQPIGPAQPAHGQGWIFKTPAGGLPAATGDTPGQAECIPYYIDENDVLVEWTDNDGNSVTETVYNIFEAGDDIPGDTKITAKMVANRVCVDAADC